MVDCEDILEEIVFATVFVILVVSISVGAGLYKISSMQSELKEVKEILKEKR